jgi:hypothetical protein
MIAILPKIKQFLDSNNIDGAREELANTDINLRTVDTTVRDFAALLALGSQKALEIGLGVLGRKLHDPEITEISPDVIWLLIAAVLSRINITPDSPSRISMLGLVSCIENWELPIFALLTPALDAFFKISLSEQNPLIAEQTLDFIATWGENYAKAPHSKTQLRILQTLAESVLERVDDLELQAEWAEGSHTFFKTADKIKYADENIWSAGGNLLKKIYTPQIKKLDPVDSNHVKDNIFRLITSSLAAIKTVTAGNYLSVAVRIDSPKEKNLWSVVASVIDKLERLLQEVADVTFESLTKLPAFTPLQAIPGSWTIMLQMDLNSNQSNLLATAIASLSSIENVTNHAIADSWQDCVAQLQENGLQVNLAVSTNDPELHILRSISTEDIPNVTATVPPNIRVLSRDIPQADSLERVLNFVLLLIQYPSSLSTVRQKFREIDEITERQFSYYRSAAKILGLIDERGQPTTSCYMLNRLSTLEAKMRFLAYQFMSSNVGSAWFNWQNANDLSEIEPDRAAEFLMAVCPSLAEDTIGRRVRTLKSWLGVFIKYF